jgi:hypothetical protein
MSDGNMSKRAKVRMMKKLVIVCYVTLICMFTAAYVGYWYGIDMDTWLTLGCGAFSLELAINACLKLFGKDDDKTDAQKADEKKPTNKVNG